MVAQFVEILTEDRALAKDNETEFVPTADYHPATKKYVDDTITGVIIDEDDMASDSDEKVPTQQSVKAYVDNEIASGKAISEILGFTILFVPSGTGLYYEDADYDVRIRESAATPGDNILIPQGFYWKNNGLTIAS